MTDAKKIPTRENIPARNRWDLTSLFSSDEAWETLFKEVQEAITRYGQFRGRLGASAESLKETLDFDLAVSRKLERLSTYARLKSDEDRRNDHYRGLEQRIITLSTRADEFSSFINPEIQSLPDEKIGGYLEKETLRGYRFYLQQILRYKPHTLPDEIEKVLAMAGEVVGASSDFFRQLNDADLRFGRLTNAEGETRELSHGNFSTFLMSPDRKVRKQAFFQYYEQYQTHRHSIASALASANQADFFYTRVRKFSSCRQTSLFGDDVPEAVYENLISTVRHNLTPLFKYLRFRRQALELDELHIYDTYVPLVGEIEFRMDYDQAAEFCARALSPLGDDYVAVLRQGLLKGEWVDRYENRGKRSGAYSSGCYDSLPYILLNYDEENINSLYTLIHEAGHSMHSYYSNKEQPYRYHGYTILVAEVASTLNEILLSRFLLDYYKDNPRMRLYILNREIDNIRATLYRQAMFAEFEVITHRRVEESRPLTLETLTGEYRSLLEIYFGDTLKIDDQLALECLRIPHFYSAFYVYKYALGISAAIFLAEKVLSGTEEDRRAYRRFLTLGNSMFPLDELKVAGVDMTKPGPVEKAVAYFQKLVEDFIQKRY